MSLRRLSGYPGSVADDPQTPAPWDYASTRLHVVSGKGGTGKTTVAAALAIALASGGRSVLLVEVEGRQGIAQLFDTPPLPYGERRIASAPGNGSIFALAIDPEAAMLEYLEMFYNVKRGGALLKRVGAVDFATTIAPGLRDVLLTGKAGESTRRKVAGRFVYDAVVLDAPPTGRIARFLTANHEAAELARVGPIRSQADTVMNVFRSDQTAVHLVTLLEEMPVQETLEGMGELQANGLPLGSVIVNMSRPPLVSDEQEHDLVAMSDEELASSLRRADLPWVADDATALAGLRSEYRDYSIRRSLEGVERAKLQLLERPMLELPWVPDGIDLGTLYELAQMLTDQGVR